MIPLSALLAAGVMSAGFDAPSCASANDEFAEGVRLRNDSTAARPHFAAAARAYDLCWANRERGVAVARNRAQAHFLAGDLPRAILAFRDGLAAAPWDADLQRGLETCRAGVAYPTPAEPLERVRPDPPHELRHRVTPVDLFAASALFSVVLAAGLAARFTTRPSWHVPAVAVGLVGLAGVATAVWQVEREGRRDRERPVGVVAAKESTLRTGNADVYPPRAATPLPRGAETRVVGRRGGWVQVEIAGGAVGWLPESAVVVQTPAAHP